MNKTAVLQHLGTIRRALYSGQISAAKVDAQRAFESLCTELGEVPERQPEPAFRWSALCRRCSQPETHSWHEPGDLRSHEYEDPNEP